MLQRQSQKQNYKIKNLTIATLWGVGPVNSRCLVTDFNILKYFYLFLYNIPDKNAIHMTDFSYKSKEQHD